MKRIILILFAIGMTAMSSTCMAGMSNSRIRKETRFLTDKMAYELNLNTAQYNDAYEINFDFIYSIRYLIDDVVRGYEWALNDYYEALDIRNDDLRWVLSDAQYLRFMRADYFYRPIYANGGGWNFRVYITYVNHNHFYFPKPYHYRTYAGGHYRAHYPHGSYYHGRYDHGHFSGNHSVRDDRVYRSNRRSDFGSVSIRPNSNTRPGNVTRPGTSSRPQPSTRPNTSTPSRRESTSGNSTSGRESSGNSSRVNGSTGRGTNTESGRNNNNSGSSSRRSSSTNNKQESTSSGSSSSRGNSSRSSSSSVSSGSNRSSSSNSSSGNSGSRRSSSSSGSSERGSSSRR